MRNGKQFPLACTHACTVPTPTAFQPRCSLIVCAAPVSTRTCPPAPAGFSFTPHQDSVGAHIRCDTFTRGTWSPLEAIKVCSSLAGCIGFSYFDDPTSGKEGVCYKSQWYDPKTQMPAQFDTNPCSGFWLKDGARPVGIYLCGLSYSHHRAVCWAVVYLLCSRCAGLVFVFTC